MHERHDDRRHGEEFARQIDLAHQRPVVDDRVRRVAEALVEEVDDDDPREQVDREVVHIPMRVEDDPHNEVIDGELRQRLDVRPGPSEYRIAVTRSRRLANQQPEKIATPEDVDDSAATSGD